MLKKEWRQLFSEYCFRCILQTVWKEIHSYFDNHSLQRVLTECKHFQHFPGIGMLQFCTIWRFFFPHKYLFFYTWRGCEGERSATWGQCSSGVRIFVRVNSVIWSRNRPKSDILEVGVEKQSFFSSLRRDTFTVVRNNWLLPSFSSPFFSCDSSLVWNWQRHFKN